MATAADIVTDKQRWLTRIRRRLNFGIFLKHFTDWFGVLCLGIGCVFLATKLFWTVGWPHAMWLFLLVIPVTLLAWKLGRRDRYAGDQSVALLDQRLNAGGLLMTVVESPDDQWEKHLPVAQQVWNKAIPAVRPWRTLKHLALPVLFLVFTCLIPARVVQSIKATPSTISRTEVSRLNEMLEELEENEILNEEEKDELDEQIQKLAEETKFKPLTHEDWETVDALKQKMDLKLANQRNKLQQVASAMAALQRSMEQSDSTKATADQKRLEELVQALLENKTGKRDLSDASQKKLAEYKQANGEFKLPTTQQELQDALDALAEFLDGECDKIGEIIDRPLKMCDCEDCPKGGGT